MQEKKRAVVARFFVTFYQEGLFSLRRTRPEL